MMNEVPPSSGREESQTMVPGKYDSKPYIRPKLKVVPDWMYDEKEDVCGRWTLPGFMWTCNLLAAIFHLILILVTILVSTNGGRGLDTPTLDIYKRELTWNGGPNATANATSMLVPELKPAGWSLPLSIVTIVFFGLSAFFHTLVCLMNFNQAFAHQNKEARKITAFTGWYFKWMHECRNPARWIECALLNLPCFPCSPLPLPLPLLLARPAPRQCLPQSPLEPPLHLPVGAQTFHLKHYLLALMIREWVQV